MKTIVNYYRFCESDSGSLIDLEAYSGRHGVALRYRRKFGDFVPTTRGGYTVCILEDGDLVAIGVASCSPKDNFSYREGRIKAINRATDALRVLRLTS